MSTSPVNQAEFEEEDTSVIGKDQTEEWKNKEVIIDETVNVRGDLDIENCDVYIKSTDEGEIIVKDGGNLRIEDSTVQPYYRKYYSSISLELEKGQNMISFPFLREDYTARDVLKPLDGHYDSVWHYDPESGFLTFKPDREDHFNTLKEIRPGMGVMINITSATILEMDGVLEDNFQRVLEQGLNMISYPGREEKNVSSVFSEDLSYIDSITTMTDGEEITLSENDTMVPGKGYWVNANDKFIFEFQNEKGLPVEEFSEFEVGRRTRIHYEPGSTGYIRDSEFEYLGDSIDYSGLVIDSGSVKVDSSRFDENYIDINIRDASPSIQNSEFRNATYTAILSTNSSFDATDNYFFESSDHAIIVNSGAPLVSGNDVGSNKGVWLNKSNAAISSNDFYEGVEHAVTIHGGEPVVEENNFLDGRRSAVRTFDSNVTIIGNTFFGNQGGINGEGGRPRIINNLFKEEGYGILIQRGSADIRDNDIRETKVWSIDVEESTDLSILNNRIRDSSFGIRISGNSSYIHGNVLEDSGEIGLMIRGSRDIRLEENTITGSSGRGLYIETSDGMVRRNTINNNHAGVELRSSVLFIGNTVSNNDVFGINVQRSSPYLEDNILSNNENNAMKFERSSSVTRRNSILNSRYHFYLIDSSIKVVDSAFRRDRVYLDDQSEFMVKNTLNASMDEGTTHTDYSIHESLPPEAEITGVHGSERVDVDIQPNSIHFLPDDHFWGTVNMTFNVTIFGEWDTEIPFVLEVNPVNNPPKLLNETVKVTYEPTKVRWEVIYEDKDGNLPTYIELVVDGDHYQMKEYNGSDQHTFYGKKYYYEMYLEPGTYEYYIETEENNTLGANSTIRTRFYDLDISPPKPGWLGMSDMEAAGVGTFLLFAVIILLYLRVRDKNKQKDSSISEDKISSKDMIKTLPVMKKRSNFNKENEEKSTKKPSHEKDEKAEKTGTKTLPVMKKREGTNSKKEDIRKHRVIKEEEQSEEDDDEETEPIIDTVSDEPDEEVEKDVSKKQRVIRNKKTVQPKKRVLKEEYPKKRESGKKKRILKED
ncbi:MAG: right-handed parallel beta-helix repeat-containing protein [Thermoplasmatota archaeon]